MATVGGHGSKPGQLPGAVDGARIGWFAPTFGILEDIWRDLKKATQNAWIDKSEIEHRIDLPGGGSVTVRSLDNPDNARGPGWDGVVLDEAAFIKKEAWGSVLRPAMTDRGGWSMHISTPNGYNWFKDLFDNAATDGAWVRWQRPTCDNPLIPQEELDAALLDMGARAFSQEHLAQFTDIEGAEFSGAYFHENIWFDEWPAEATVRWRIMALDPSKGKTDKSDYSAFIMLVLDETGTMWVDADLARRDTRQIVDQGCSLAAQFKPDAFGVEANQFQEVLIQNFEDHGRRTGLWLPIHAIQNTENKITRIRATLTPELGRDRFRFKRGSPGARLLVDQLRGFPIDNYDDGPDALEMAVRLTRHVFEFGTEPDDTVERLTT